jgi:DNA-binding MarR family transcriptional regulator
MFFTFYWRTTGRILTCLDMDIGTDIANLSPHLMLVKAIVANPPALGVSLKPVDKSLYSNDSYRLWLLFMHVKDALIKAREKELDRFGVTITQVAVFLAIENNGGSATPGYIAGTLFRTPHSISETLQIMQKNGLITKTRNKGGGNSVDVSITERGKQLLDQITWKSIERIMSSLPEEQRNQLKSCLMTLWDSANQELETKPPTFFLAD